MAAGFHAVHTVGQTLFPPSSVYLASSELVCSPLSWRLIASLSPQFSTCFELKFYVTRSKVCGESVFSCIIQVKLAEGKQTGPRASFWFMFQAIVKSARAEEHACAL